MCLMFQNVKEIAKRANIPRLQGSVSVLSAMEIMDMYEVDILAVECEEDFAGIFTRNDFMRNVIRHNLSPRETTLYEVMTLNPPSVEVGASVKEAYETMLAYQWEYMPVVEGRKLCGIVSMRDLGNDVMKSLEEARNENQMIMNYIQSGESYAMASYISYQEETVKV